MALNDSVTGCISKLKSALSANNQVHYQLPLSGQYVDMNALIGQTIQLEFTGKLECTHCGAAIKKSYQQGYCFLATRKLAQCDLCILKPEQCHFHQGTCREPEWGVSHCMQDHIVYLANTSGLKVGITRQTQVPTRWIDQGAAQALPVFRASSRYISGQLEVAFAQHISDKTNWRALLQGIPDSLDLITRRDELVQLVNDDLARIKSELAPEASFELLDEAPVNIYFPITEYPTKIKSHNFDKIANVTGQLLGIKGQYLIFDTGVLNIRKFTGYEISISANTLNIEGDLTATAAQTCPFAA